MVLFIREIFYFINHKKIREERIFVSVEGYAYGKLWMILSTTSINSMFMKNKWFFCDKFRRLRLLFLLST